MIFPNPSVISDRTATWQITSTMEVFYFLSAFSAGSISCKPSLKSLRGFGCGWKPKEQDHPFEQHPTINLIRCNVTPHLCRRAALSNSPPALGGCTPLLHGNDLHLSHPTSTAISHAKDDQHEMPVLGDHTHLTTADTIIQSHKGVLSYYFWAANTQEVVSN